LHSHSLFWPRFNEQGAPWSIYGGLITAVGLIIFSPVNNPGIVAIPVAFFLG
jgi:cation/acetate symporter